MAGSCNVNWEDVGDTDVITWSWTSDGAGVVSDVGRVFGARL